MKTNQFEAVCKLASDEWWCWDLNCTTCGNMHFTYAFKEMRYGKSPEDDDWLTRADVDHEKLFAKLGRPIGPPYYKVPLSDFGKEKLIKICSEARISNLAENCAYPEWLAYMGWALFGLKISSENYKNLANNWAKQLKDFIVRSRSKDDLKIKKFLDKIINSKDYLLDHFALGSIEFITDKNTHPWVAVNSYYIKYEGELKNGVKHGKGKEISRDGRDNYEGEFKEGLRNGIGTSTSDMDRSYEGEWKNGKKHGKGKRISIVGSGSSKSNDEYIQGQRVDKNKIRTFSTSNASFVYEGEFREGWMCGKGIETYHIDHIWEILEGNFEKLEDDLHVKEILEYRKKLNIKDGYKSYALLKRDAISKRYIDLRESSGSVYDGEWKDGQKHGIGKEIHYFGDTTKFKWEDVRSIETVFNGVWKEGKIWNGEKFDKDGNVIATFVNGDEK